MMQGQHSILRKLFLVLADMRSALSSVAAATAGG